MAEQILKIELGEVVEEEELPGMRELRDSVFQSPISNEKIDELRKNYYPNFSDDEIILIEHTIVYSFLKFQLYAKWTFEAKSHKPQFPDFGLGEVSTLEQRLEVFRKLHADGKTGSAFASLEDADNFLEIPGNIGLVETIAECVESRGSCSVADIGCGGQSVDFQIVTDQKLAGKNVQVVGVGAYDYGQNLRNGLPELKDKVHFVSMNAFYLDLPNPVDIVFSVRTLPYTGVVDAVRFCDSAMAICKQDGLVWIADIDEICFDFSGTEYANLEEYLESLTEKMPSLKFSKHDYTYAVSWKKSDGSPFSGLIAKSVMLNQQELPYLIRYGLG